MADIPGDTSTTSVLTVGSTVTGTLETLGDHDWYTITLTAGQSVVVTLNGVTFQDTYLYIRDQSGNLLFSNDDIADGNLSSQVAFSATYSGTYYIDVAAWNEASAGQYQVSVQPYSPPPLATNDQIADQLVNGYWGGDSHHFNVTQGGQLTVNISTLNASEQAIARTALAEWTDIIGVTFREVTTGGQIIFSNAEGSSGSVAQANSNWNSSGIISSSNVQISSSWVTRYGTGLYSYSLQTYVHEIGHALGLGHAGNYNGDARYPYDARFQNDAWSTSIMSYFDQQENTYFGGQGFTANYALTPMVADILAMQQLYGLSTTTRTGDTTYGYNANAGGVYNASLYPRATYTVFDSGGSDTLDFSGWSGNQTINLNPETFSSVNGRVGNITIARGVVIEKAIGGSGADTVIGNSSNNVLTGNGGSDTFTGGGGNDTFLDTLAGHNGDRITDFSAGDVIVFSNASVSSFTFSLSGNTLTYSGGSLTFGSVNVGSLQASAAATGGVQLTLASSSSTPLPPPGAGNADATNDFNGDGFSDILWRSDAGLTTDWLAQQSGGFSANSTNFQTQVDNGWQIAGTGDFNGDGRVDLLWRNSAGLTTNWLAQQNGSFSGNSTNFLSQVDNSWHIVGTGDFNGDGRSDILWRNNAGLTTDWLAQQNGSFFGNSSAFLTQFDLGWSVAGTGDFNGDGRDDILWRKSDGTVVDWLGQLNGGFSSNSATFQSQVVLGWHIVGVGDFNGDGRSDILWRDNGGTVTNWLGQSNGSFAGNSANSLAQLDPSWHVAQTGDFNGDGRDDILWRHDDGAVTQWLALSNGSFVPNSGLNTQVDISWHVQPIEVFL